MIQGIARKSGPRVRLRVGMVALLMCATPASGQVTPTPPPPVAAPSAPPPASTPPAAQPEPPKAAEAPLGDIREIEAKPVVRLKGQSTWDNGFEALKTAVAALDGEAKRLNLPRNGNPIVYFTDSDDLGFTYEAMAPLGAAPPAGTAFGKDFDFVMSPSGRAVVFPHEGAYDDIDTAYEALAAWLDDKNLVSTGKFIEEYEFIPEKSDEITLRLKIVVFLK